MIDNRYGGRGNGFKLKPLTDLLKNHKNLNKKGKLFVLTIRNTKGTVMELTSLLEINTKAIIIGEPTGEGPNSVGDTKLIELPNSKIKVSLTKKFWPTSWKRDNRETIEPHLNIEYTYNDYKETKDPWLTKVYEYKHNTPTIKTPKEVIDRLVGKYIISGRKVTIYKKMKICLCTLQEKLKIFLSFILNYISSKKTSFQLTLIMYL